MTEISYAKPLYEKMDPGIKKAWVEKLRSGEVRQARGALHRVWDATDPAERDAFCCLGVLCKVGEALGEVETESGGIRTGYKVAGETVSYDMMPTPGVLKWASLDEAAADHLAGLNDVHRKTFPEIADWIEEHL